METTITRVRAFINDNDYCDLQQSDEAIKERILSVQNDLIGEFSTNIQRVVVPACESIELENEIAKAFIIRFLNTEIKSAMIPRALHLEGITFTHLGGKRYALLGLGERKGELEIIASFFEWERLVLGERYARALILGVVCEFLLLPTNAHNLERLQFYRREYREARDRLHAENNRALNPTHLESRIHI